MIQYKHKIIGLYGNRGVGKDTLYHTIAKEWDKVKSNRIFYRRAFADKLKEGLNPIAQEMFGKNVDKLNPKQKEIFRPILIAYGCAWREIDPLHWVKIVDESMKHLIFDNLAKVIITDVRFPNEAIYFKKKYKDSFYLIGLDRKGAPEPTDEEKKHIEEMRRLCNIFIVMKNDPSLKYTRELSKYLLGMNEKFKL